MNDCMKCLLLILMTVYVYRLLSHLLSRSNNLPVKINRAHGSLVLVDLDISSNCDFLFFNCCQYD